MEINRAYKELIDREAVLSSIVHSILQAFYLKQLRIVII